MDKSSSRDKTLPDVPLHNNAASSSSAAPYYVDNDGPEINIDDLPPSYSDVIDSEAAPMLAPSSAVNGKIQPVDLDARVTVDGTTGAQAWVAKSVEDPDHLETYIQKLSRLPPRPYIQLVGTHTEETRDSKGKPDKNTITDFDVTVDLTPYLYADVKCRTAWAELHTVDNSEEVRRGTVLRRRGPGSDQNIEVGADTKPTLQEWCHRFAASPAGLKCFTLQRKVVGFDEEGVRRRLVDLVHRTNYRGHLQIQFVTKDARVDFYNDVRINRWRSTRWVKWLFILTLMFIFSWPYLFFRTKRWEVVTIEWPFSRINESGRKEYISISEDQWYNLWGHAIFRAVLEKRQTVLDQSDIRRSHEVLSVIHTGNIQMDSAGLYRASVHAMNEVNRQLGWGGDC